MINARANITSPGGEKENNRQRTLSSIRERSNDTCGKGSFTGERFTDTCGEVSPIGESFKKLMAGFPLRRTVQRNSPPAPSALSPLFQKERGDDPERGIGVS